jgi:hypothetical protein
MKTIVGLLGSLPVLLAGVLATSGAFAQDEQSAQPQAPPPPSDSAQAPPSDQAPPVAEGQWVYTDGYGWVWVPAGAEATAVNAQPYVYLYTPTYGWTWFVSPWGFGAFRPGPWIHERGPWVGVRPAYRYAPGVWHGVAPHPYGPSVGPHFNGGVRGGYRR